MQGSFYRNIHYLEESLKLTRHIVNRFPDDPEALSTLVYQQFLLARIKGQPELPPYASSDEWIREKWDQSLLYEAIGNYHILEKLIPKGPKTRVSISYFMHSPSRNEDIDHERIHQLLLDEPTKNSINYYFNWGTSLFEREGPLKAAEYLNVGEPSIGWLCRTKQLAYAVVAGKRRFRKQDLDRYVRERLVQAVP